MSPAPSHKHSSLHPPASLIPLSGWAPSTWEPGCPRAEGCAWTEKPSSQIERKETLLLCPDLSSLFLFFPPSEFFLSSLAEPGQRILN